MVKSIASDSYPANPLSEQASFDSKLNETAADNKVSSLSQYSQEKKNITETEKLVGVSESETLLKKSQVEEENKREELESAFEIVSDFMKLYSRNVNFSLDDESDKTIIKVFDSDSKELIKQFPSEDLLELARKIYDVRQDIDLKSGIFLDEKV
jgi:flagellar protein FlaG